MQITPRLHAPIRQASSSQGSVSRSHVEYDWREGGQTAAVLGTVAAVASGVGARFGPWGAVGATVVALGGSALLSRGLDPGPAKAATVGLTAAAAVASGAGAAFGVPGVIGATAVGIGIGLWNGRTTVTLQ